jgi:preprotein translocase SecE subunit
MSVSETPPMDRSPQSAQQQFAITSMMGGVVLLASLALLLAGLPWGWDAAWNSAFAENEDLRKNVFLSDALMILLALAVIGALAYVGYHALQSLTQPGVRAGIVFFAIAIFFALVIGVSLGTSLEDQFSDNAALGGIIVGLVIAALLAGVGYVYLMVPAWKNLLETIEQQGWFHGTSYKGNQGVRVRRGTILGILAIGVSGIVTMAWRSSFGYEREGMPNNWEWMLPFTDHTMYVPLLYKLHLTVPILLSVLLFWLAWRIVNVPTFGDFLIATEAEMNKVSWTNRRRLFQDTVVVLTTVFLFTAFLFTVDVIWIRVLSMPGVKVLLLDPTAVAAQQQQKAEW